MSTYQTRPYKKIKAALKRKDLDGVLALANTEDALYSCDKKGKHRVLDLFMESPHATTLLTRLLTEHDVSPDLNLGDAFHPMPLLRHAVRQDDLALAKLAISQGAYCQRADESGMTLMHDAAEHASPPMLRALAAAGTPVDLDSADRGDHQSSPLHIAIMRGELEVITTLLELGADPMQPNWRGEGALHLATWQKDHAVIEVLMRREDIQVDAQRHDGRSALHLAAHRRDPGIAAVLLEEGAEVDLPDDDGWTPLHLACARGDALIVELLIAEGADTMCPTHHSARMRGVDVEAGSLPSDIASRLLQTRIREILSDPPSPAPSLEEVIEANFRGAP